MNLTIKAARNNPSSGLISKPTINVLDKVFSRRTECFKALKQSLLSRNSTPRIENKRNIKIDRKQSPNRTKRRL